MSHIYDPLSRIDLPPPRHDVESDSEEDTNSASGDDEILELSTPSSSASASLVVCGHDPLTELSGERTILVGRAGEGMANALDLKEQASVQWKGKQVGSLAAPHQDRCSPRMLLYPGSALMNDLDDLSSMVRLLLKQLNANSLVLVDEYNPTLYIDIQPVAADDPAPIRFLSSAPSSSSPSPSTYLPTPTHPFSPPNFISHPTHTLSALLLQEAVYAGIPARMIFLPSTMHQARPHARLVSKGHRRSRKRHQQQKQKTSSGTMGMQGLSLGEEFPSDDDEEDELQLQDEADPEPLLVELPGIKRSNQDDAGDRPGAEEGKKVTAFVEIRRKSAARRRTVASGMYV